MRRFLLIPALLGVALVLSTGCGGSSKPVSPKIEAKDVNLKELPLPGAPGGGGPPPSKKKAGGAAAVD